MNIGQEYLRVVRARFVDMKKTAERAMDQCSEEQLFHCFHEEANSIAIIVKHMSGNMVSRWTDFLSSDGEKPNRNRDDEFINDFHTRKEVMACWEKGWSAFFQTLNELQETDLLRTSRSAANPIPSSKPLSGKCTIIRIISGKSSISRNS